METALLHTFKDQNKCFYKQMTKVGQVVSIFNSLKSTRNGIMTKLLFCRTNYEFKATFTKEPSITIQCNSTGGKQPGKLSDY